MKPNLLPAASQTRGDSRFKSLLSAILALWVSRLGTLGQGTTQVGFDVTAPGVYSGPFASYTESGVFITGLQHGALWLTGGGITNYPDNGTGYLHLPGGAGLTLYLTPGASFNLISFDLAEVATGVPGPATVQVVGWLSSGMGRTVTTTFTTDGINDGTGPLQDFQTFFLDSRFQNIDSVDFVGSQYALDNVVISGVPEPSSDALILLAMLCRVGCSRVSKTRITV